MPTLDQAMLAKAQSAPEDIVLQDPSGAILRGQLAVAAYAASQKLRQATQAERVGVCLPSIKEYAIAVYAVLLAGKTVVPINFLLQPKELGHVVKDAGLDLIITSNHFADALAPLGVNLIKIEDVGAELAQADLSAVKPAPAPDANEIAVVLYTSGTTALPKGVQLSHGNILAQGEMVAKAIDLNDFHVLSALPLFHTFALTVCCFLPTFTQIRASLLPRFNPSDVLEAFPKFGANTFVGVPSMHRMLARVAAKNSKRASDIGLTLAIAGGERLPPEVYDEYQELLGLELVEGYGMTEHAPIIALNPIGKARQGFAGQVLPGVEARVVDPQGNELGQGQEGELEVRSPSVMQGYLHTSEQPFHGDGWLKTGDLALLEDGGWIKITGRLKELIISAGKNIHP
ncbi:MAG: AMP-binding protein, partial [Planctomycetes bacterium]|nr:AMP-binding protein [Planctomycetota bacterium]